MERILILGASGYIGSQLVPALLEKGYIVRAAGKFLSKFNKYPWVNHPHVEIVEADVLDQQSLENACRDCAVVYYLVHSMGPDNRDFVQADRQAALNTVGSAEKAGVQRIVYLGGLGKDEKALSKHLRSRMEVLHILHAGKVPVTSLRAAMIIGHGSISFEILRTLVDRLPLMIAPRWIFTESQPIAGINVVHYLLGCLEAKETIGEVFDIGGADIVSYHQLMDIYADEAKLKKPFIIPVPLILLPVSFVWIEFITGYPPYIVRPLLEGLKNRVVCQDNRIKDLIPQPLLDCRQAIRLAIGR
jgi:uncharacterized protein YbjT (DUF2867 family)